MVTFGVNPGGVLDSTDELRAIKARIEASVAGLDQVIQVYIEANSGEAQAAFLGARATWQAGLQKMEQALAVGASSLAEIHDSYLQGDRRGAAYFGGGG